ncbi:hypothetical protein EHM69_10700 [candidate division KSB1 bacterium]|nr:MAG: hypothetical protein EHM69_10700 [candidate division KSB1 bacterium]
MPFSITDALYEWMHKRRIVSAVAQCLGVKESTLSSELHPARYHAKLGADELIPLCEAIRQIGYGHELRGILHRFISELENEESRELPEGDLIPQVLKLNSGLGTLSECAAHVSRMDDEAELIQLRTMLRTEMLPVLLKMEDTIEHRLKTICKRSQTVSSSIAVALTNPK